MTNTRLDYEPRLTTELCGFFVEGTPMAKRFRVIFGMEGPVSAASRNEVLGHVKAYEDNIIARVLSVATDEELAVAGLVRRSALVTHMEQARSRLRARSNAEALGVSATYASLWATIHQRAMQALELYVEARADEIRWRKTAERGARNPLLVNGQAKGNALLRVAEEIAERRVERESEGATP